MRNSIQSFAALFVIAMTTTSAMAETRHANAHVHGTGTMNFAIEDQKIFLDLTAPGFDILGFETISSNSQRDQLERARAELKRSSLWSFPADAGCTLVEADSHVAGYHDEDEWDDHDDDHHDHDDDHHDHDKKHKNERHIDLSATYVYHCQNIKKLNSISTSYFKTFSRAEKLVVQGITTNRQVGGTMTRQQPKVDF